MQRTFSPHSGRLTGVGLVLALLMIVLPMSSAHAATYQYWGYWSLKGSTWTFSQKGPADTHPADGSIEGWRWSISGTSARHPRGVVTFAKVCAGTPAKSGDKRVAVVIDYGRAADASTGTPPSPIAKCAQVPTAATGADVLADVTSVRNAKGLVCGISNWPASGCGGEIKKVTAAQQAPDTAVAIKVAAAASASPRATASTSPAASSSSGAVTGWVVAIVVIILIVLVLLLVLRRRRAALED
ncbi:SCO2322 family protein [Leekyejoonella antrihumi]|uniref:Secreted protein n=1 Tax=Leekyejoonella antrihumi TaxID=1660198 RepID=A0A563E575_9MICO|nr:SCO2322 family protein [Leekyejoonella antrihumi]TWP37024.1 hypothetical protein FGL98_08195 [Leekyejoonella antrihumi]